MGVVFFILGAAIFGAIAIALGATFFNSSVHEQEHQKGWD